ncbi:MAG TPA: ABC transporter ATPase, partial [Gemmatimonadetes bacterium]|nr:ABC transporter ATPase [Gemmatimonadota bacterium]
MPRVEFDALPDRGRLWVFPATQALTSAQSDAFLHEVDSFLDAWAAHGIPLRCGRQLRDDQFLIIGVDVDAEAPSGCSIDALVNRLRGLGTELSVSLIDHAPVWYRA